MTSMQEMAITILVVEASPAAATHLSNSLAGRFGNRVHIVATASVTEALRLVANRPIHLVVANVRCGDGGGLALCRALRALPDGDAMPIMLVGEQVPSREKIAGFASGADDYIVRPMDDRMLAARIELLWRIKRMEQLHS